MCLYSHTFLFCSHCTHDTQPLTTEDFSLLNHHTYPHP
nr:MAG TPA: hypothetical protein [Caudoviricetes sp.]